MGLSGLVRALVALLVAPGAPMEWNLGIVDRPLLFVVVR